MAIKFETIVLGWLMTNCYILYSDESYGGYIIDPSGDSKIIIRIIEKLGIKPLAVINTHGHADHIAANKDISNKYQCPIWIHKNDAPMLTDPVRNRSAQFGFLIKSLPASRFLEDADEIRLDGNPVRIIHTPGHTSGSICLHINNFLFSGDTLFYNSVGRTDLGDGDYLMIEKSIIQKLYALKDDTIVFPGHGSKTLIGEEKIHNNYVRLGV